MLSKHQSILKTTQFVTVLFLIMLLSACGGAKSNNGNRTVTSETNIIATASYANTSCAIKANGSEKIGALTCWGQFPEMVIIDQQTGEARKNSRAVASPFAMSADATWLDVAIGDSHICGIKSLSSGNRLFCMGWNDHGQMGLPRFYYQDNTANAIKNIRNFYPTMTMVGLSTGWKKLSAASEHTCGIYGSGDLKCWGKNSYGVLAQNTVDKVYDDLDGVKQTNTIQRVLNADKIPDEANWLMVSTNDFHTCGLKKDEAIKKDAYSLWCWGRNNRSQLGISATSQFVTKVIPPTIGFNPQTDLWIAVSSGNEHTCAISATKIDSTIPMSGKLWCWGNNRFGEGGNAKDLDIILKDASAVGSDTNWTAVSVGYNKSCAVNDLGEAYCFGYNASVPFVANNYPITAVAGRNENWTSIQVGHGHECGVKTITESNVTKSQLYCWGQQQFSQLGTGFLYSNFVPNLISNNDSSPNSPYVWKTLAGGGHHSCTIKNDNSLWCWGRNYWGQLGLGFDRATNGPKKLNSNQGWMTVDSYFQSSCAKKMDNTLWCWGKNTNGQVGNGIVASPNHEEIPVQIDNAVVDWGTIAIGQYHTCALKNDNSLWCWGSSLHGQLGSAIALGTTPTYSTTKVQVPGNWKAGKLFSGKYKTCGIKVTVDPAKPNAPVEQLMCWGRNGYQEIDAIATTKINTPTVIPRPAGLQWISASLGKRYICALAATDPAATEGSLWCWGDNYLGVIGDPSHYNKIDNTSKASYEASRFVPVTTPFNVNTPDTAGLASGTKTLWRQVSAHDENVCAIRDDGTLWCWGDNRFGENGNGTNVRSLAPTKEATGSADWVMVSNGDNHTCGLKSAVGEADYSLWCWGGRSFERQIGDSRLVNLQPTLIQ